MLGIKPQTPGTGGDDANLVTSKGTYLARRFNALSLSRIFYKYTKHSLIKWIKSVPFRRACHLVFMVSRFALLQPYVILLWSEGCWRVVVVHDIRVHWDVASMEIFVLTDEVTVNSVIHINFQ